MNTLNVYLQKMGLQKKLMLSIALVSSLYCLVLLSLLYFQLNSQTELQTELFGEAMSHQLLDQVRQPLLHQDVVSLQVVLDNLVVHTGMVAQAAVFKLTIAFLLRVSGPCPPLHQPVARCLSKR